MILEVDETNISSISEAIAKLHKLRTRLCKKDPKARLSNTRYEKRLVLIQKELDAILGISKTDVSKIYENTGSKEYYVYVHCNPLQVLNIKDNARHFFAATELKLTHVPFYVGKGIGNRANNLSRNEGHKKIRQYLDKVEKEIEVIKIKTDLTEGEALALESKLIDIFGLKALCQFGMLTNLDEGMNATERRTLYPKGSAWYLNKIKLQPYSVPLKVKSLNG